MKKKKKITMIFKLNIAKKNDHANRAAILRIKIS